jgi:hypothetical protein
MATNENVIALAAAVWPEASEDEASGSTRRVRRGRT